MAGTPSPGPAKSRGKDSDSTTKSDPRRTQDRDHDAGEAEDEQATFDRDEFRAEAQGDVAAAGAADSSDGHSDGSNAGPEIVTSESDQVQSDVGTGETGGEKLTSDDVDSPYAEGWDEKLAARSREKGSDIETPHTGGHDVSEADHPGTSNTARRDYFENMLEDAESQARANARNGDVTMGAAVGGAGHGLGVTDSEGNMMVPSYTQVRDAGGESPANIMAAEDPSFGESGFEQDVSNEFIDPALSENLSEDVESLEEASWEDVDRESWTRAKREEVIGKLKESHRRRINAAEDARNGLQSEAACRDAVSRDQKARQAEQEERIAETDPFDIRDFVRGSPDNEPVKAYQPIKDADEVDISSDAILTLDEKNITRVADLADVEPNALTSSNNISDSDIEALNDLKLVADAYSESITSAAETVVEDYPELSVEQAEFALEQSALRGKDPRDAGMELLDSDTRIDGTTTKIDHLSWQDDYGEIPADAYESSGTTPSKVKGEVIHTYEPADPATQHQVFVVEDDWGGKTKVTIHSASKPEKNPNSSLNSAYRDETRVGGVSELETFAEGDTIEISNFATSTHDMRNATTNTAISVTSQTEVTRLDTGEGPREAPTGMHGQSWSSSNSSPVPDYTGGESRQVRQRNRKNKQTQSNKVPDKTKFVIEDGSLTPKKVSQDAKDVHTNYSKASSDKSWDQEFEIPHTFSPETLDGFENPSE